jgi:hypothetical protein
MSSSGSHIGYHEAAAAVDDSVDSSSSENDKENRDVIGSKGKGNVTKAGRKKKKNKVSMTSCLTGMGLNKEYS